jgi:hypothetical protein
VTTDSFEFYAKHYSELAQLRDLEEEVAERYPDALWYQLQKWFSDRFAAGKFAGQIGWKCNDEGDGPDDHLAIWNPRYYDSERERGPLFLIAPLSKSVTPLNLSNKQMLKPLISCYLAIEKNGGGANVSQKALVAAAQKDAPRLRKHFEEVGEPKDCFVQISLGELLHVSSYANRAKNFSEMERRVEQLAKACVPVIEASRSK